MKGWKPDIIHIHVVRMIGSAEFASGVQSLLAIGFEDEADKRNVLLSRALVSYPDPFNYTYTQCNH